MQTGLTIRPALQFSFIHLSGIVTVGECWRVSTIFLFNFVGDFSCRSVVVPASWLSVKKTLSANRRVGRRSFGELS